MQEANHIAPERAQLDRLRAALAAAGDVAYEWDLTSDRITWFGETEDVLGFHAHQDAPTGEAFSLLIKPDDVSMRLESLDRLRGVRTQYDAEYHLTGPDRREIRVHDRARAEIGLNGHPVRLTGILRRVPDPRLRDGLSESEASYDTLTGHFNRVRLREALDHAVNFAARYKVGGAFLVIGIDNLTVVNQALGHEIADCVLLAVANRVDGCLRASDVIGRMGGDRFGIVLSNVPEGDVGIAGEKVLEAIRECPVETEAGPVYVTVSIGAVSFPQASDTSFNLIMRADAALQKAKQNGRDCLVIYAFSETQVEEHKNSLVIAGKVQRALREDRLRFAYQPIVESVSRETQLHECLLRMIEPDGIIVPAARFMPVVEHLGMIRAVDRTVLERGIQELSIYPDARLAINVSGLTTTDRSWMRTAVAMLRGRPDFAERLMIEITETAGLEDLDACCRFVSTLRDLGCQVALDDFGAGYTSFRHLKKLAVNKVKIDGSFVRKLSKNPDHLVFIRTLVDLARTFNLETVAECVETEEEADLLLNEGVNFMQGYAFGRPDLDPPWEKVEQVMSAAALGDGATRIDRDTASQAEIEAAHRLKLSAAE